MITRLLARGIGVARISRKSKKEVQHHRYRLICKYAFVIFINFESFFVDFHEWIDTWITHRNQQYMEWLKKVNEDLRKCERAKADIAGRDKGTPRE